MAWTKEEDHHTKTAHHTKSDSKTEAQLRAEGELKLKGLTPKAEPGEDALFTPMSVADQKLIHENYGEGWKKINVDLAKHKEEALKNRTDMEKEKQDHELNILNVKKYDEEKKKPDFLCVVENCGEEKAPGQGYHCRSHCKST